MKKIKEWVYLLFCPKWERRLYKLLKRASQDKKLSLDTVLYDDLPAEDDSDIVVKAGVDAMFVGWIGVFNTEESSLKTYDLQNKDVVVGASDKVPEASSTVVQDVKKVIYCNPTLKEYIEQMSEFVASDEVRDSDRLYLKDISEDDFLGLKSVWKNRQDTARKMIKILSAAGIKGEKLYSLNFNGASDRKVYEIEADFKKIAGVKATQTMFYRLNNWATMVACYCSSVR